MEGAVGRVARMSISLFDTATPLRPLRAELAARVAAVLDSGRFILGPEVAAFEGELASYLGVRHVIGVANGTDAITIALRALGVQPGAEVVVPSFTFYASAEAIVNAGAVPVFCDVDYETRNVTPETVKAALTPRTAAILAVDLFGCPAPYGELRALGVPVLEDAAQAAGASLDGRRAGALADAATFSFFPSKNLGCFGDGGMIVTSDEHLAEQARILRFHGSRDKVDYEQLGYNSRLDELQAAILRVQLPHLPGWADGRRAAGARYEQAGLGEVVALPRPVAGASPAWHLYVIAHSEPNRLEAALSSAGIGHKAYYRTPVHRQPPMARWGAGVELPGTEEAAARHLAIPMSPILSREQATEVVAAVGSV